MTFSFWLEVLFFARARKIEATKTIATMIAKKPKKIMKKLRILNSSNIDLQKCMFA